MQKAECNRSAYPFDDCHALFAFEQPAAAVSAGNCQRTALFSGTCCCILTFCHFGGPFSLLPRGQQENKRIERYAASFGNVGFIGIPLVTGIFGAQYAVFAVVFVVVFHVLSWTVGVGMLKGSFREVLERSAVESGGTQRSGSGARCL